MVGAVLTATVIVGLMALSPLARAAISPSQWFVQGPTRLLPAPSGAQDHSGIAPSYGDRWFVVDNGDNDIIEYQRNALDSWQIVRVLDLDDLLATPPEDMEDITPMGPGEWALLDERNSTITAVQIPQFGNVVTEMWTASLMDDIPTTGEDPDIDGIEGIDWDEEASIGSIDVFWVVTERDAELFEVRLVNGNLVTVSDGVDLAADRASAVVKVPGEDAVYIVNNQSRTLHLNSLAGAALASPRQLSMSQPEGAYLTAEPRLYIVCLLYTSDAADE